MKCTVFVFSCLLALIIAEDCRRTFNPPPVDDCTTFHSGAADEIQCFVYVNGLPNPLDSPQANTRTCYRTCHTSETCEASLTGVHNKNIPVQPGTPNSNLRLLFSPNYNKPKDYRKSTICSYDVSCTGEQILGYMFVDHILESRTDTCETENKCVDYIKLTFPSVSDTELTCGEEAELDELHVDGYSGLHAEFYANRYEQDKGFLLHVMCYEPGAVPSRKKKSQADECVLVSGTVREPETVDSAKQLREIFMPVSEYVQDDLQTSNAVFFTVNELETLSYSENNLIITRRDDEEEVVAQGIGKLYVSSRFAPRLLFDGCANTFFKGYAELWVSGQRAYLLRLGINPLFKPTAEERAVIVQLAHALSSALECTDFFDVYDEEDAEEEGRTFTPSVCENHFVEDKKLSRQALEYGNACNDFLKFFACSYQAVILQRNCTTGEQIVATTNATKETQLTTTPSVATIKETPSPSVTTTKGTRPPTDNLLITPTDCQPIIPTDLDSQPTTPSSEATTQETQPPTDSQPTTASRRQ